MIKKYFNTFLRLIKKPITAGVLVFISCLCITVYVTYQRYLISKNIQQRELTNAANAVKDKIEANLKQGAEAASTFSYIVKNYAVGNNFDSIASEILRSHKNVDVLQLVKGGIITHVYPLKGNEAAIGFDILADSTENKGLYQAIERKEMHYGGPYKLVEGGKGIAINLPIFIDNRFLGFSRVIIKLPTLIRAANLENDINSEYSFQLSRVRPRTNKEEFYLPGADKFKKDLSVDVAITEGKWKIYASFNKPQTFFSPIPFLIIGFLLSIGAGLFMWDKTRQPQRLKKLVDEQSSLLNNAFELSAIGMALVSLDGKWMKINEELCKMLGYTKEELLSITFSEVTHPDDVDGTLRFVADAIDGKTDTYRVEKKYIRKDGSIVWGKVHSRIVKDDKGQPLHFVAQIEDITVRKKAEEKLRESEERHRSIVSVTGAWEYHADIGYLWCSPEYYSMLGRDVADYDMTGNENLREVWIDLLHPEDRERAVGEFAKYLKNGSIGIYESSYRVLHMNGSWVWIWSRGQNLRDAEGNVTHLTVGTLIDITERKKAEEKLRESEERYKSIIAVSNTGAWEYHHDTDYTWCSPEYFSMLGLNHEDYDLTGNQNIKQIWIELLHPDDVEHARSLFRDYLKNGSVGIYENYFRMRHANGSWVWIWSRGQSLRDAKGNVTNLTLGTHIDITERKLAEEKLSESEVRFREVLENSISASYKRNLLTNSYEYLSPVFKKIAGYTQEEMNSLPLETVIGMMHPDDIQSVTVGITKALTELNGMPNSVEYRFKHKMNNEYRWLRDEFVVMQDEKSLPVALIGSVSDVTEQKSMEIKLRQSEERHRALVQNIADGIVLLNEKREVIYQSSSVDRINGFSFEERNRKPAGMLLHPDDKPAYMEFLEKVYSTPEEPMECQFRIQHKKGYYIWVEGSMINMLHDESVKSVIVNYHDITERKLAELKLRESEEKHRALIENISDAIILMNEQLKTVYRSPSVRRIVGYTPGEIRDKEMFDFVHPNDLKTTRNLFQKARNTPGVAIQGQFRVLHNSGHYIWVEGTVMNMLHIKSINALIVNFREITERKKFEEQQLLMTSIVNSSDDAIISKDLNGIITSWNKGAEKIFGYASEEMIGKLIYTIIPAELKAEEELFLTKIKKGNSVDHYETRRCRKDGVLIDVSLTISPIKDSAGNIIGASKILSDITERKKAEELIKQSEANYRQLFDNSPAPMWVIDEQTHTIIQANQAAIKNYGYSEEEFLGLNMRDISPDHEYTQDAKTGMNSMFFMGSQWHVKKSGELINVLTSSMPTRLNGEKNILMIAIDVTEKNLYEQKLTKAAIKAQEDERYEIGGELHDNVCQILAGSLMFLGLMKDSLPTASLYLFDQAYKNITSATSEIRGLSHRLAPAFFDDETLQDAFARLLKEFNVENKYNIRLWVDHKTKQQLLGRDQQLNLYRILQEQLRNIGKHAKATEIEVEVYVKKSTLLVRIADNGIGFNMKTAKGGIGLANMNRRAQLFSGTFTIKSAEGKGCEALVEIPLAPTD